VSGCSRWRRHGLLRLLLLLLLPCALDRHRSRGSVCRLGHLRLVRGCRRREYDALHAHNSSSGGNQVRLCARGSGQRRRDAAHRRRADDCRLDLGDREAALDLDIGRRSSRDGSSCRH